MARAPSARTLERRKTLEGGVTWSEDSIDNLAFLQSTMEALGDYFGDYIMRPALKAAGEVIRKEAKANLRKVVGRRRVLRAVGAVLKKSRGSRKVEPLLRKYQRKFGKSRLERALVATAYISKKRGIAVGSVGIKRGTRIRHAHLLEFGTNARLRLNPKIIFAKAPRHKGYSGTQPPRPWLRPALEAKRAEAQRAIAQNINERLTPENVWRYEKSMMRLIKHRAKRDLMRAMRAG